MQIERSPLDAHQCRVRIQTRLRYTSAIPASDANIPMTNSTANAGAVRTITATTAGVFDSNVCSHGVEGHHAMIVKRAQQQDTVMPNVARRQAFRIDAVHRGRFKPKLFKQVIVRHKPTHRTMMILSAADL